MKPPYSDEDLTAFLDGKTTPEDAAKISADVATDTELARRIEGLAVDTDALKTAFDPVLGIARTRNLEHVLECANSHVNANSRFQPNRLLLGASLAAAVIVGVGIGSVFLSPKSDWRMEVAHYQALYVPDTLAAITPDADRLKAEFSSAGKAVGLPLDPQDFSDIDGFTLRRAQVLGFEGSPLVQIAFTLNDGSPIAFCILAQSGKPSGPETDFLVGLAAASWSTDTHRFLAIGGDDAGQVLAFAKELQRRIADES